MTPSRPTIAIIAPYFPPLGGGLERYTFEIASRLAKSFNWHVVVITSGERNGKDTKENVDGLTIYKLSYSIKFSNTPFSLWWYKKIKNIFEEERPNIVNIHMPVPGIGDIAMLAAKKIPIFVTYHAGSMNKNLLVPDFFVWFYEHGPLHILLNRANRIICASDFVRFTFLKRYEYKSITATPGVDSAVFYPDSAKKSTRQTILFVAGLSYAEQHKGLGTLLDALVIIKKKIPDIRLIVVGEGEMKVIYKERADNLGLKENVIFYGRLAGSALAEKYQEATVFALPSVNENFSMAILEAMACGLPVVATNVGGLPLLVKDNETGFLIPPRDSGMLVEKLMQLLSNPDLCASFGEAGMRKAVESFDWQQRVAKYDELFEKNLGRHTSHIPRLIIITPYFFPKPGGLEQYAYSIAKRLHENGAYRVSIITSNHEKKGYSQDVVDGMTVHRLPIWRKFLNTPINPSWYWWMRSIFKLEQPDIINAHTPVPFIADIAKFASNDTPFILTYHNDIVKDTFWANIFSKMAYTFGINRTLQNADRIIVTSKYYTEHSPYLASYKSKMSIVSPGVDLTRFNTSVSGTRIKEKYGSEKIVLFVGNMNKSQQHKGLKDLISAFAITTGQHPDAKLVVVGSGDGRDMYERFAKQMGISEKVVFAGRVSDEELPQYFAAAAVEILPSTNMSEGFGMVAIEASACGTPVIGTRVGGIPYAIEDNVTGLLIPPKNPKALSEAMHKVLSDTALAKRLGEAGAVRTAKLFDWEQLTQRTKEIFMQSGKPTIAQIVSYYPPHLGGMETVAKEVALEIAKREYPTIVVTSNIGPKTISSDENETNYQVRRLHSVEFAHLPILFSLPYQLLRLPKKSIFHVHVAQAGIPEVALIVSRLKKIPFVAHFHLDVGPSGFFGNIFLLYKKYILVYVLRTASKVIVFSEEQSLLIQKKYGVQAKTIAVIPNGINEESFTNDIRKIPHIPLRLLYVGRLATQKRVERLIETMKLLNIPAHLSIVGDGEDREKLELLVQKYGLTNVSFEGRKNGEALREYYRNADIFLTASEREGMSLVALEAMAAGLPIIGTNVIGTRELIEGAGILVDEPYAENFVKEIIGVVNEPGKLELLSLKSIQRVEKYSIKRVIDELELIYKKLLP